MTVVHPIRVLYVEDDLADQELTRRHLERHAAHLTLRVAGTVGEALEQLETNDADLVLSDYRLPDGTGLDVLEAIRARDSMVPVVLVTRSGDVDAAVDLLKAGAADYVVKRPGYLETLPTVLEAAFRWSQSVRELRRTAVHVLYAEHDPADVELTRRAFRDQAPHFQIEVVSGGRDALERLRAFSYDLFLLDYRMPDLSGIEILKALREERIRLPVVMVTGQGDEETAAQAFKLDAADYIIKRDGYLAKLGSSLENVLAQHRLAEEKDALLVLNGLSRSIATLREVPEVVQRVTAAAADLLKVDMSIFWLVEGPELYPAGWSGLDESVTRTLRFQANELDRAGCAPRILLSDLIALRGGLHPTAAIFVDAERTLAVPLVTATGRVGVLAVASGRPRVFSRTDERLLTLLADHAAITIENVRLYRQVAEHLDELRRTQAQLIQTEKVAAMGQLLAGVAHELNNPLAVVLGRATLLGAKLAGSPLEVEAEKIAQAAKRSARIVSNFLALARQRQPQRQRVALNQVVQEALELLAYQLRVDDVELTLNLAADLPTLWADPHQLHQVVINLISNAHQALREAPQPRRVTLTTRSDSVAGRLSLEVADTGPGIPPEIQRRVFEPFFTTKPEGQGTGLGLTLCQGIIEAHGGNIGMQSEPRQGTAFVIDLPVTPSPEMPPERSASEPLPQITGKSILVVDDEPELAQLLRDLLSEDGHHVEIAASGRLALKKLLERSYDLILSDVRMPDLDGPAFYREVERQSGAWRHHFIFLTGDVLNRATLEFVERTTIPTVSKPFTAEKVREVVQQVLRSSLNAE